MCIPNTETTRTLRQRKTGSYRVLSYELGNVVSIATLNRIARGIGPVSAKSENAVRLALGLPALISQTIPVPVCPTCGHVHAVGDCHGIEGEAAIIPLGYVVKPASKTKTKRNRRRYWRPAIPPELRQQLEPLIKQAIEEAIK